MCSNRVYLFNSQFRVKWDGGGRGGGGGGLNNQSLGYFKKGGLYAKGSKLIVLEILQSPHTPPPPPIKS